MKLFVESFKNVLGVNFAIYFSVLDRQRLERQGPHLVPGSTFSDHRNILKGKHVRRFKSRYGSRKRMGRPPPHSGLNKVAMSRDKPAPPIQLWSKREANANPEGIVGDNSKNKSEKAEIYAALDSHLESLEPDPRCAQHIGFCAKMKLKNLECILHCQLSTHALAKPSTKFLFRLMKVYANYPRLLCPTFGKVYNEIPSIIQKQENENSLLGFLAGVGITDDSPLNIDFIKNAPSSLFNNLVKFAEGEDISLVQSILSTAETAITVELAEKNMFPSAFGNPTCKLAPKESWYVSMIDSMTKHPTLTDIFLRGYWILSRALKTNLPYPLDSIFVSLLYSIKLMAGVDCSIIAYAEQGKPFKCKEPPPVDEILDGYAESSRANDEENTYSWMVCGAHQVELPEWLQKAQGLEGRSDTRETTETQLGPEYDDLDEFPNPDETD